MTHDLSRLTDEVIKVVRVCGKPSLPPLPPAPPEPQRSRQRSNQDLFFCNSYILISTMNFNGDRHEYLLMTLHISCWCEGQTLCGSNCSAGEGK